MLCLWGLTYRWSNRKALVVRGSFPDARPRLAIATYCHTVAIRYPPLAPSPALAGYRGIPTTRSPVCHIAWHSPSLRPSCSLLLPAALHIVIHFLHTAQKTFHRWTQDQMASHFSILAIPHDPPHRHRNATTTSSSTFAFPLPPSVLPPSHPICKYAQRMPPPLNTSSCTHLQ